MIVKEHDEFAKWMSKQSVSVKMHVSARVLRVADRNFGDARSVGGGVSELRIHAIGYRIYYTIRGKEVVILLCGGEKSGQGKEQNKDIKKAQKLAKEV
jgi:putative addiction module killer protein